MIVTTTDYIVAQVNRSDSNKIRLDPTRILSETWLQIYDEYLIESYYPSTIGNHCQQPIRILVTQTYRFPLLVTDYILHSRL